MALKTKKFEVDGQTILIVGGLAMAYFGLLKPITNFLGLTTSSDDRKEAANLEAGAKANGWAPGYYKSIRPAHLLFKTQYAIDLANAIYNARGFFNDDEEKFYGTLRMCKSQAHLSQLADIFYGMFRTDMYGWIRAALSDSEMVKVASIVTPLPNYLKP